MAVHKKIPFELVEFNHRVERSGASLLLHSESGRQYFSFSSGLSSDLFHALDPKHFTSSQREILPSRAKVSHPFIDRTQEAALSHSFVSITLCP